MMAPNVGQSTSKENNLLSLDENDREDKTSGTWKNDGENYESYGEMNMDGLASGMMNGSERRMNNGNTLKRNTWLRSSLRKSGRSSKRLGSNTFSSQVQRSSSFNSSGRSSICDTTEDVYSDISLEEDVLDLNHKIQMLQQQMNVLADNQVHSDERYTRAKQENATLQARVLMLEEQLREVELRAEEKLVEEERRHRELVARVDREKQLQVENCAIRLQTLELENTSLRDEANRSRLQAERLRNEKSRFEESLSEKDATISSLHDEIDMLRDNEKKHKDIANGNQQLIEEMNLEIERLQGELKVTLAKLKTNNMGVPSSAHEQLQAQFSALREENKKLQEAHDEMQAILLTRSVEEGRSLLTGNQSLAAELEAMSQDEPGEFTKDAFEVRTALKEQQEVNAQLRAYIDGILLLIVENHPQLLEVKPAP